MRKQPTGPVLFVLCTLLTAASAQKPYAIFLGNSITYSRSGVDTAMMKISAVMGDSLVADREVIG
ncbi:MAG: hypothetical protein GF331_08245, partial [Chitinivibrionales bacterium]|nr:hypothetical protein [Chitinivibrionales bacterium]